MIKDTVSIKSRILMILLCAVLCMGMLFVSTDKTYAKTDGSDAVSNVFFYAADRNGDDVLLSVMNLKEELLSGQHGLGNKNYSCLMLDKFPTTNYCEGKGYQFDELIQKAAEKAKGVEHAESLTFVGNDKIAMMTTDNQVFQEKNDNYSWNELYGVDRYFYPKLYDVFKDNGINYKEDTTLCDEIAASGMKMPAYVATSMYSGRVSDLISQGILNENITGEDLQGSLKDKLDQQNALRVVIPPSENEMRNGATTANNSRKWVYGFRLTKEGTSPITSKGTVNAPTCQFKMDGSSLVITMTCSTKDAEIYHSINGQTVTSTPQYQYTGPIRIDHYDGSPITLSMRAVKSGYSDQGIVTHKWTSEDGQLALRRSQAVSELNASANLKSYRTQQQTQIKKILSDVTGRIQAASSEVQIEEVLKVGKAQLSKVPTAALMTQTEKQLSGLKGAKVSSSAYNAVKLGWSKVSTASGYQIYRSTKKTNGYTKLTSLSGNARTSYTNTGLRTETAYYYKIRAYKILNGNYVYGSFSSPVSAKPALKKTSVKLTAGKRKASIRWSKVSGASGYQIYRSTKKSRSYKRVKTLTSGKSVKYTNKKLKKGKRYYYKVRSYRTISGKKVYSGFSTVKSVKVK